MSGRSGSHFWPDVDGPLCRTTEPQFCQRCHAGRRVHAVYSRRDRATRWRWEYLHPVREGDYTTYVWKAQPGRCGGST